MSTATDPQFDPYHKWLGIPPVEQPPNLYRLLGLTMWEEDSDVIAAAADRQMSHVKSFSRGTHAEHSQQLLNELSKARVRLLNPKRKREYDQKLKQAIAEARAKKEQANLTSYNRPVATVAPPPAAKTRSPGLSGALPTIKPTVRRRRNKSSNDGSLVTNLVWLVVGLSMIAGLVWLAGVVGE